jgi:AcrR family transcriptional regulator
LGPASRSIDGRKQRSDVTRRRLLGAAAECFSNSGFEGATLDEIAGRAQVNKALIRYHFRSKQGLYSAVLQDAIAIGQELLEPIRSGRAPASEELGRFVDALAELARRKPFFIAMVVREWLSGGRHMEEDVFANFTTFFQVDREILERGMQSGEFRKIDPHSAHLSLVGSFVFFQISQSVRDAHPEIPGPSPEAYREHVKELFRRGLAR